MTNNNFITMYISMTRGLQWLLFLCGVCPSQTDFKDSFVLSLQTGIKARHATVEPPVFEFEQKIQGCNMSIYHDVARDFLLHLIFFVIMETNHEYDYK